MYWMIDDLGEGHEVRVVAKSFQREIRPSVEGKKGKLIISTKIVRGYSVILLDGQRGLM